MTINDRMSDLLAITARLIVCLEQEVELLRAMRPEDIAALQADKAALAQAYEAHLLALNAAAEEDEPVERPLREALTRATEGLQAAVTENARALKAVRAANDRVLKAIVEAVERRRDGAAAYTASGAAPGPARTSPPAPVCMAVDRRL